MITGGVVILVGISLTPAEYIYGYTVFGGCEICKDPTSAVVAGFALIGVGLAVEIIGNSKLKKSISRYLQLSFNQLRELDSFQITTLELDFHNSFLEINIRT